MNERKSELKKQNEEEKNPKAGDIAERMKREISELFGKIEEFVKSPSLSKSERNEATALANETKNLKEGIEIISENVKSAGADVLKGPEIDWHDLEEIKSFDSELKPIKRLHVSFQSFNRVYLCEHPQYGSVVIKMPSSKEEINFLEGTKDTQGVTPIIKSYEYGWGGNKRTALLTKYIKGTDLRKVIEGKSGWRIDDSGVIYNRKKKITTKEEIVSKVRKTVNTLHKSLNLACFDIKPINVLMDNEGNPYLFDFDIQFGSSRNAELRKWFFETLSYPPNIILEKVLTGPILAILELLTGDGFVGFKDWLTQKPMEIFPGEDFREFRQQLKDYKKYDLEDTENLFNPKYACKSLTFFLGNLPVDHPRWNL